MEISSSAVSPLDGRYHKQLLGLQKYTSEHALTGYRVQVEMHWFIELIAVIPHLEPLTKETVQWLHALANNFSCEQAQEVKRLEQTTNHDVKAVEYWLKEQLATHPELSSYLELIHFACTSEDINNVSYGLMQLDIRKVLLDHMSTIETQLTEITQRYCATPMLSRTHGQAASPTTLGKEIGNVVYRLRRQRTQIEQQSIYAKMNGAVGNYNAHQACCPDIDWITFSQQYIEKMGLDWNPMTIQIEPHDTLAEFMHTTIRYNTILLDYCRDIWGYISIGYFTQKTKDGEIGSSTMPHKVNPIDFENAEGNLGMANAILSHMASKLPLSRWQRDLSDSTVMRNLGSAFGYCVIAYSSIAKGTEKLQVNTEALARDLDANYEILAEPIQTVMRYHRMDNPYEQLKTLTRGKSIDKDALKAFIRNLDLPTDAKEHLLSLTPDNYTGLAEQLVHNFVLNTQQEP